MLCIWLERKNESEEAKINKRKKEKKKEKKKENKAH